MARRLHRFWREAPIDKVQRLTAMAVYSLWTKEGGPYSRREVLEIVRDVMGMPEMRSIRDLSRRQCQLLVIRLMGRSVI